jgi:hypothetical protein
MLGVSEWFAEKKPRGTDEPIVLRGTDQPVVLHGDAAGQQSSSYAATEPGKPYWLVTAFPPNQK